MSHFPNQGLLTPLFSPTRVVGEVGLREQSNIISRKKRLVDYWTVNPRTGQALKAWFAEADAASWTTPADVRAYYGTASILKDNRVVFNICGNDHRLVVSINCEFFTIYIRFLGSHEE